MVDFFKRILGFETRPSESDVSNSLSNSRIQGSKPHRNQLIPTSIHFQKETSTLDLRM